MNEDEAEQAETDAWGATIDRRLDELLSGAVESVSGRETLSMARAQRRS